MQSPSCPLAPVGLETWLPESLGLERPGFGGWPGVGMSGERPEFGQRKLAAGLRGFELYPVGAGERPELGLGKLAAGLRGFELCPVGWPCRLWFDWVLSSKFCRTVSISGIPVLEEGCGQGVGLTAKVLANFIASCTAVISS